MEKDFEELMSYDFSEEKASSEYQELDGIDKFFAYMMVMKKTDFEYLDNYNDIGQKYFKDAYDKILLNTNKYGEVIDADSESELLKNIYRNLFAVDKYLGIKENDDIFGETLNSTNTTLNRLYEIIENDFKEEKEKRTSMKVKIKIKEKEIYIPVSISIKFIIAKYLNEKENSNVLKELLSYKELEEFVKIYHTIGNFMPIPYGCNGPRGTGVVKDYWDLTLLSIYNYYMNEDFKGIEYMIGVDKAKKYAEWLDKYGDKQEGWDNFVLSNYLGDEDENPNFVKKENEHYGLPRELWNGHFDKKSSVLPVTIEECIDYFKNAKKYIKVRSEIMVRRLKSDNKNN